MNYVLGPMKCSGKQHLYPAEVQRLKKEMKEQKFNDVVNQAENNEENLEVLDRKIKNESENISNLNDVLQNVIPLLVNNLQINFTNFVEDIREEILRKITDQINQITLGGLSNSL